uniref:Carbonyl reductase [NADPH] 1 n=1 Tax=Spermophilus dauricus TaxID=99837 RepID=A0A8C9PN18_SPEDA
PGEKGSICLLTGDRLGLGARAESLVTQQQQQAPFCSWKCCVLGRTPIQSAHVMKSFGCQISCALFYFGEIVHHGNCLLFSLFFLKVGDPTPFHIQAEVTMKTNFFGTRDVCTKLLSLIKPQGRVVNVSSVLSLVYLKRCSPELQQKFRSETITEEELVGLMSKFVEDAKNGVHEKEGWPNSAYGVSKIGVTVLSRIYAWKLSEQRRGDKILLNACCPGWVRTDMTGPSATKSPEEGAETPVYLALLPPEAEGPHGQFVQDKKVSEW